MLDRKCVSRDDGGVEEQPPAEASEDVLVLQNPDLLVRIHRGRASVNFATSGVLVFGVSACSCFSFASLPISPTWALDHCQCE